MIPKAIYELKPYLYLVGGSVIIVFLSGMAIPAGILLYALGAWLWLMRSEYRRVNARQPNAVGARFYWNDTLYELQPFMYILGGLMAIGQLQHGIRFLVGALLILTGCIVIGVRTSQRKKVPLLDRSLRPKKQPHTAALKRKLEQELKCAPALPPSGIAAADIIPLFDAQAAAMEIDGTVIDYHPLTAGCEVCQIVDVCESVKLDSRSVQEIMRLSQTVVPDDAFELYREAVERIEGRRLSDGELRAVLNLLYSYSSHCVTWRKTGRLAAL